MIVIKEEFVGGEKHSRAMKIGGGDAIAMWLALKCYASLHPAAEGFIADEDIDTLAGAPRRPRKALQALVDCGRLLPGGQRGPGLVDPVEGGWRLHDYLDHSVSPEEEELRRTRARLKKKRQRADKRRELEQLRELELRGMSPGCPGGTEGTCPGDTGGHVPGDTGGHVPGTSPGDSLARLRPAAPVPTRDPNPTLPNPNFKTPPPPLRRNYQEPRASAGDPAPLGLVLELPRREQQPPDPRAEHVRFAEGCGLDLGHIEAQCHADPGFQAMSAAEQRQAITRALIGAAAELECVGGAA